MEREHLLLAIAILGAVLAASGPALAQAEHPYNNTTGTVDRPGWTDDHADVTVENVSHYVSRVAPFVIGDAPNDAGAAPLLTGLLVMAITLGQLGTSRVGFIASTTLGIISTAALAQSAGLLPSWFFVVVAMALGAVAAYQFKDQLR